VASEVLDLINGKATSQRWSEYLETVGDDVVLKHEPSDDYMCDAHEELIRKHWNAHVGTFDPLKFPTALVEYSHTLPEWTDPRGSSVPISQLRIWECQGVSREQIAAFMHWDDAAMSMHALATGCRR